MREFSEDYYVLGLPFLRAYYTLFDLEAFRIGLALSVNFTSRHSAPIEDMMGGVVVLCGIVIYFCWRTNRKEVPPPKDKKNR